MHLFYKKTPRLYAITTVQCQQQLDDCCDETKEVVVEFYDDEDFFFSLKNKMKRMCVCNACLKEKTVIIMIQVVKMWLIRNVLRFFFNDKKYL